MGESKEKLALFFQGAFAIVGLASNIYISAIIIKDLGKKRSVPPREKLVVSLGFINICLQIFMTANNFCSFIWPYLYLLDYVAKSFLFVGLFLMSSSLWISTWFCVYCSLKITNTQQNIVKWLQQNIVKVVPWLITGSFFLALIQSIPAAYDTNFSIKATPSGKGNMTIIFVVLDSKCSFCAMWIYLGISFIAFIVFFTATLITLCTLGRHMKNMESIFGNPQLDKLFQAAKTVTLLLFLCIVFYVSQSLLLINITNNMGTLYMLCIVLITMFPSLNAAVLVMGNQKLKQPLNNTFKRLFRKDGT